MARLWSESLSYPSRTSRWGSKRAPAATCYQYPVLYLVVCWLILDPVHVVLHMLEVPAWANRLVLMLMAVGFRSTPPIRETPPQARSYRRPLQLLRASFVDQFNRTCR